MMKRITALTTAFLTLALTVLTTTAVEPAKPLDKVTPEMERDLLKALATMKDFVGRDQEPSPKEVEPQKKVVDQYGAAFDRSDKTIKAALDLVSTYDKVKGPLFVARGEWDKGHRNKPTPPANDIHWTMYHVMQYIMDEIYTAENIQKHRDLLDGFKFGCSAHFPGSVAPPSDAGVKYAVKINATAKEVKSFTSVTGPRRPTGAYVAPGSIVHVSVPKALVNKGYTLLVGAHTWDNTPKRRVTRMARASRAFDIDKTEMDVANPLGGAIYVEVPLGAEDGIVEISFRNAVRSPFFSAKSFHKTTLEEWLNVERKHPAPWADFETDKFLMNVPTMWVSELKDPVKLMKDWDTAMNVMDDLMAEPAVMPRHTMYLQVDLQNRGRAFFPGYPTCNDRYDPRKADEYAGYADHYLVRGPQTAPNYVFHEQGHAYNCPKYKGETEATVNLPHVAVWNIGFGIDLDKAFSASRGGGGDDRHTVDNTAITWMCSHNFANKIAMKNYEKQYQWKGHAKYVDIVKLYGWEVLRDYFKIFQDEVAAGTFKGRHSYDNDEITLRKCIAAGVDLRPLMRFWGIEEDDSADLAKSIAAKRIPPSAKVYDRLVHYKSLVPAGNKAFREFAQMWWQKEPSPTGFTTERNHADYWNAYDEETAAKIRQVVQDIIDEYYPAGRPQS